MTGASSPLGGVAETSWPQIPSLQGSTLDLANLESLPGFELVENDLGGAFFEFKWGPPEDNGLSLNKPVSMKIWFDPSNHGLPLKTVETWYGERTSRTIHTDCNWTVENDRLKSAKFVRRFTNVGEPAEPAIFTSYVTLECQHDSVRPENFRLPEYGLPEPPEFRSNWITGWSSVALYLVLGIASLLLLFGLFRMSKQRT